MPRIVTRVLGSYTRGVIAESIIVGIVISLGSFLIGLDAWLLLGAIALAGEIVPIIGTWIVLSISLPVILVTQPDKAVLALGFFVVIQIVDGWFLGPRFQGGSLHFSLLATLIIVASGGVIAGPLGMILALPAVALLRDITRYTSYRVGGQSPSAALGRLPLFQRDEERRRRAPVAEALPAS